MRLSPGFFLLVVMSELTEHIVAFFNVSDDIFQTSLRDKAAGSKTTFSHIAYRNFV